MGIKMKRIFLLIPYAVFVILLLQLPDPSNADHDETHITSSGPEHLVSYPHGSFSSNTEACGQCHSLHRGKAANLIKSETKRDLCFLCHDGRGSNYDVKNGKYYNSVKNTVVDNVAGGFNEKAGFTSKHLIEEVNAPPGGNNQSFLLVCTSCHNPHGTNNHRNLQTTINGRTGVSVKANIFLNEYTNKEVVSYESGIPNFCSSCHKDYVYYHNENGVNDPTKYRHPIGAQLNGGTRSEDSADGESPKSVQFSPTLFTTLPTEGPPSGAYPNPKTTAQSPGGSLNGQYHYIITATNQRGESHEGYIKSITVPANGTVSLVWDTITNSLSYSVYRAGPGTKPSGSNYLNSYKLIADSSQTADKTKFNFTDNPKGGQYTFVDTGYIAGTRVPPSIPLPNTGANAPKIFCLTCHFAHGTKSVDGFTGQSKLKRIDNMGVCQNCHKR